MLPAQRSLECTALPIGLAHDAELLRPIRAGTIIAGTEARIDESGEAVRTHREMEARFGARPGSTV